jgi:type III pantothenate kinase
MKLLIDIGNSLIKWAVQENTELGNIHRLPHADCASLFATWNKLAAPEYVVVAQVGAPSAWPELERKLQQQWPESIWINAVAQAEQFGVRNAYRQPQKLGVDRWLALLAAHAGYPGVSCIIDCGTAVTIDILGAQGQHRGGWIMPGLQLMTRSLTEQTAALPETDAQQARNIAPADHTRQAIVNGCVLAIVGSIEAVAARQAEPLQLIVTGGDGPLIAEYLNVPYTLDCELVFKGLALIGQ